MKVVYLNCDGPPGVDLCESQTFTWDHVQTAIRRLDGETYTLLVLGIGHPAPHMGIGGGDDGKYIVYVTPDNVTFFNLVKPNTAFGKMLLTAGGQPGEYDLRQCVELAEVLRAAQTYVESGELDPSLLWEES